MNNPFHLLILENSIRDTELLLDVLKEGGFKPVYEIVSSYKNLQDVLPLLPWEIVISDYSLPDFSCLDAHKIIKEKELNIPLIVISGSIGEEAAINLIKAGVHDFILKQNLPLVINTIEKILNRTNISGNRPNDVDKLKIPDGSCPGLIENIPDVFYITDKWGKITFGNSNLFSTLGYRSDELIGQSYFDFVVPEDKQKILNLSRHHIDKGTTDFTLRFGMRCKNGDSFLAEQSTRIIRQKNGKAIELRNIVRDITEREHIEGKINLLVHSLKSIRECVAITDLNRIILFVNEALVKTYGFSDDEVIGKDIRSLYSQKISGETLKEMDTTIREVGGWYGEILSRRKDGTEFPISLSTSVVKDQQGNIVAVIGVAEDITERKQKEESYRKHQALLNNAFEIAKMGHWEYDIAKDLFTFNDNFYNILRTTAEREGGYTMTSARYAQRFVHPDDYNVVGIEAQKAVDSPDPNYYSQFLCHMKYADGETGYAAVRFFTERDENGKTIKTCGISQDITEIMRAEHTLQRIITDARCLIWRAQVTKTEDKYEWQMRISNESAAMEFLPLNVPDGYTYSDVWQASKFEDEITGLEENYINAIQNNKPGYNQVFHCRIADGTVRWLYEDVSITPLLPGEWEFVGVCTDITDRKQTEEKLIEAKQKAEEMNKLKSSFLANMSHELRTPLMGILGFADILRTELNISELREMAETISESGTRLLDTLNLILDLSRIEADHLDVHYELFELVEHIKHVAESNRSGAEKKGLYLRVMSSTPSIKINLDLKLLTGIMQSLLKNAIKYTGSGGITVTVDKEMEIVDEWALIKIADTGIGIPKESQEIIFEEFRQASEGYSRNFEGVGIGLTITKKLVEKMKGYLSVESETGKGSTFIIRLPLSPGPLLEKQSATYHFKNYKQIEITFDSDKEVKKSEILLVEDDSTTMAVTEIFLKKKHKVTAVSNAFDAIEAAKKIHFDVILMDINLGQGLSGLDAVREIRKMPEYINIPIIASTAFALDGDKEEFFAAGCTHYLAKPFSKEELYAIVSEAIKS